MGEDEEFFENRQLRMFFLVVGVIILFILLFLGGLTAFSYYLYRDSFSSSYDYEASIYASGSLENVEIYLPVASLNGPYYSDYVVSSEEWEVSHVDVDGYTMLKLENENATAERRTRYDGSKFLELSFTVENRTNTDRRVSTEDPFGEEPMLRPRRNLDEVDCFGRREYEKCYEYRTHVKLDLETDDSTETSIRLTNRGQNEWWVFGWSWNYYEEELLVEDLYGNKEGWKNASVRLKTNHGSYPFWG